MGSGFGRRMLQLMARITPEKLVSATIASEGDLTKEQVAERVAQIMADPDKERFTLDLALAANHSGTAQGQVRQRAIELFARADRR